MSERYDKDQLIDDIACAAHGWGRDVRKTYLPLDLPARVRKLYAEAQALADVRTLDEWLRPHITDPGRYYFIVYSFDLGAYVCSLHRYEHTLHKTEGATPDEARAKAAAWVRKHR